MAKKKNQLKLVTLPAENLREPSKKLKFPLPPETERIIAEMIRVCRKYDGIGLAAPQVGLNIQLVIINLEEYGVKPFPLVNPEIKKYSGKKIELEEGCLSIPGKFHPLTRSESIDVKAYSLNGKLLEFKADGLLARVIQHEVDHIQGKLFIDHLDKKAREELIKDFGAKA